MGISSLLRYLNSIKRSTNIRELHDQRCAVDALCWLHRGTYNCATELCLGMKTTKYVEFCVKRVQMLLYYNIKPILVFDGADLPAKGGTNDGRSSHREEALQKGNELYKQGKEREAYNYFKQAINVTPEMYLGLIHELKKLKVDYVIAPYEADAQLAFLSRNNYVDFVISEDSDTLPYGCKCVLYKLDKDGDGELIRLEDLGANQEIRFINWTHDMFVYMCILSGCDYLSSISKMGIKTANKYVTKGRTPTRIFELLRLDGYDVDETYEAGFLKAVMTFRHQTVYDPKSKCTVPLLPIKETSDHPSFLGDLLPQKIAQEVAEAVIHPFTHKLFYDESLFDTKYSTNLNMNSSFKPVNTNTDMNNKNLTHFFKSASLPVSCVSSQSSLSSTISPVISLPSTNSRYIVDQRVQNLHKQIDFQKPLSIKSQDEESQLQSQSQSQSQSQNTYISLSKYFTDAVNEDLPSLPSASIHKNQIQKQQPIQSISSTKRLLNDENMLFNNKKSYKSSSEITFLNDFNKNHDLHIPPCSSPLVSTSFKPLIEIPSNRQYQQMSCLDSLDVYKYTNTSETTMNINEKSQDIISSSSQVKVIPESPPRQKQSFQRSVIIRESPLKTISQSKLSIFSTDLVSNTIDKDAHLLNETDLNSVQYNSVDTQDSRISKDQQEDSQFNVFINQFRSSINNISLSDSQTISPSIQIRTSKMNTQKGIQLF